MKMLILLLFILLIAYQLFFRSNQNDKDSKPLNSFFTFQQMKIKAIPGPAKDPEGQEITNSSDENGEDPLPSHSSPIDVASGEEPLQGQNENQKPLDQASSERLDSGSQKDVAPLDTGSAVGPQIISDKKLDLGS